MNKHFLVTAGPTHEKIDPVRFIGNYSSGKMGYAIAEELACKGAKVTLVSGPVKLKTVNSNIKLEKVTSALEMYDRCVTIFPETDGAIMSAAVADFMPDTSVDVKIKRRKDNLELKLIPTKDIAAALGKAKKLGQLMVGFALETNDELYNAQRKLKKKNLDFIVLNSLNDPGAGFDVDTNKITILDKDNNQQIFELKAKAEVAKDIVRKIIELFEKS